MRTLTRQFVKFGLVGVLNTALHYGVFLVLFRVLGVPMLVASAIGYCVGLVNSFLLNRSWTFRVVGDGRRVEFVKFVVVNLIALGVNLALLEVFTRAGVVPEIGQVLAIGGSMVVNFLGNRVWVFRTAGVAGGTRGGVAR